MSDYLYKAFAPSKNGKKQICLNDQIIWGRWVYGSYIAANECCDADIITCVEYLNEDGEIGEVSYKVLSETVCAAIPGLKDSKGRQIYNHDIVECKVIRNGGSNSNWEQVKNINHGKCRTLPMEVYYNEKLFGDCICGYSFRPTEKAKQLIEEYEKPIGAEKNQQHINWYNIGRDDLIAVIGNIVNKDKHNND